MLSKEDSIQQINRTIEQVVQTAKVEGKLTGFFIGNTAKIDSYGLYFTPIRNTSIMVAGGVVVYSEKQAIDVAKAVDGKVQYILVDAEKKIPNEMSLSGEPANVERAVREVIQDSALWVYKGNDLSVDAIDALLAQLTKKSVLGIGGSHISILGAGNLGTKLALKLVERGANVTISRRKQDVLDAVVKALNYIKPIYTTAIIKGTTSNEDAAKGAEILVGSTQGKPIITSKIIENLADQAIIVDVGKGTLHHDAIKMAEKRNLNIYRLDVSAAFEGVINKLWATENIVEKKFGRRFFYEENLVSGGLLGRNNEIIVDNVWSPTLIYGIADGTGDFVRNLSANQSRRIKRLQSFIENTDGTNV